MSNAAHMLPASHHRLLLEAALAADPVRARLAREHWAAQVDLDKLDFGSLQLLPLLAARSEPIPDANLEKQVRHVVRFTWLRTQLLNRRTAPVVAALRDAGLDPLLSKGAALVNAHGVEQKLRPMFDIDVAVPAGELVRAKQILSTAGFHSVLGPAIDRVPGMMARDVHAAPFVDGHGTAIDLHWHLLHTARSPLLDARFRARAVDCRLGDVDCRATGLEDSLVVAISHGTRWARAASVRWVGDVGLVLRDGLELIDWDQLELAARETRLGQQVADALTYVSDLVSVEIPKDTMRGLRRAPVPLAVRLRNRRANDARDEGPVPAGRLGALAEAYEEDAGSSVVPGRRTGPADVARFLARRWGLASARRVPAHAAWVAAGRPWSWRRTAGARMSADDRGQLGLWPHYELGTELLFDGTGNGYQRLGAGWWYPESHGVWSRTHCGRILLPLPVQPTTDELELRLTLCSAIAPARPRQDVTVVFGSQPVARETLDANRPVAEILIPVPARELTKEVVAIVSICSSPVMTPADSRLNSDLRQIGVGLLSLSLAPPAD